jgi:hypothetical protein
MTFKQPRTAVRRVFNRDSKFSPKEQLTMPLIEIPLHGKDVSLTLNLPEETAHEVKLYARFLKAFHESAISAIINECVRRTLKQDTEFQTWKANPANTRSNRGGSRPRKSNAAAESSTSTK